MQRLLDEWIVSGTRCFALPASYTLSTSEQRRRERNLMYQVGMDQLKHCLPDGLGAKGTVGASDAPGRARVPKAGK